MADLFAAAGGDPEGVETSICARNFEVEIDIRALPGGEAGGEAGIGARLLAGSYYGQTIQIWAALLTSAILAPP